MAGDGEAKAFQAAKRAANGGPRDTELGTELMLSREAFAWLPFPSS
jgi:hypothetical protein